ncbi:MAG: AAA family ATPase, partial [Propionibacteriaceae bacterium]
MDTVLAHEQAHLAASRAALNAMHEAVVDIESIGVAGLGDHYSAQILKQHFYRRKQALADDPNVALFFGRLDYQAALGAELDETLYIGRRHVTGELGGEPLVTDWRAPMSLPFYRATPLDPMGCSLRRRFGFHRGELTAYEDEPLAGTAVATTSSALLQDDIEKPRTGPMRDIVATIQPEQDLLVRAALEESRCIQGAPGTGKTAVGLHRAA